LESTHGYLFAMGEAGLIRLPEAENLQVNHLRDLDLPEPGISHDLVMLGTHTHILHHAGQLLHTIDLGLSWEKLDPPAPVHSIWTDVNGSLVAATESGVFRWQDGTWTGILPLPDNQPIDMMRIHNDRLYALAGGRLYLQSGN